MYENELKYAVRSKQIVHKRKSANARSAVGTYPVRVRHTVKEVPQLIRSVDM